MVRDTSKAVKRWIQRKEIQPIMLMELYTDFTEDPRFQTVTFRFAQYSKPVTFPTEVGTMWQPLGFDYQRLRRSFQDSKEQIKLTLDNVTLEQTSFVNSQPIAGARCRMLKVFDGLLDKAEDHIVVLDGVLTGVGITERALQLTNISHYSHKSEFWFPNRVFKVNCNYRFGGPGCEIDLSDPSRFREFTVQSGSTDMFLIYDSGFEGTSPGNVTTYWDFGYVMGLTGANKGVARYIKKIDDLRDEVMLRTPLLSPPAVGDTFKIIQGCGKPKVECIRHANIDNYGGYAEVPQRPLSLS